MNRYWRTPWFGAAIAVAVLIAGCHSPDEAPAGGGGSTKAGTKQEAAPGAPGTEGFVTPADLDKGSRANKPYHLALVIKTRNNPFYEPMITSAQSAAQAAGATIEIQAPDQETDKERQFALVQDVVARGADAILIDPTDSKAIVPALKQAQDKKILLINVDNRVDQAAALAAGVKLGGYVGADNELGGHLAGTAMVTALSGKGNVAIIEGIRGVDNAEARKRGFLVGIKKKLKVVASESGEWDTEKAYSKTQAILAAHPELNGIFCANDKMAIGAIKAIAEAGKTGKITVVGYDDIPEAQTYLANGQMYATINQHPDLMGADGAKLAIGILNGTVPQGKQLLVPLEVITKSNLH